MVYVDVAGNFVSFLAQRLVISSTSVLKMSDAPPPSPILYSLIFFERLDERRLRQLLSLEIRTLILLAPE
ncbi:MAG TPA: hypothetical protein VGC91_05640 [Pyrinomonadaceae bacterium]